ncbi:hypothetical protein [Methanopyrus sp.]
MTVFRHRLTRCGGAGNKCEPLASEVERLMEPIVVESRPFGTPWLKR